MGKMEAVVSKIDQFRSIVKELVSNACHGALLSRGFVVDETIQLEGQGNIAIYSLNFSFYCEIVQENGETEDLNCPT